MELAPWGTLRELMYTVAMTDLQSRYYFAHITKALEYLHSVAGISNNDVALKNIVLAENGKPKVSALNNYITLHLCPYPFYKYFCRPLKANNIFRYWPNFGSQILGQF